MSAGGQSVNSHAVMKASENLYSKLISISGPNGIPWYNDTEAQPLYEQIAANLDCCRQNTLQWGVCRGGVVKQCVLDARNGYFNYKNTISRVRTGRTMGQT